MKRILLALCLALETVAPRPSAAAETKRDTAGFLPVPETTVESTPSSATAAPAAALGTTAPAAAVSQGVYLLDDKHKLLAGDRVSFQIVEDRTNALPLLVAESSELDVPYIGRLSVAGKTCKQVAFQVKEMLDKDYYYNATVIIGLDAITKVRGKVYVFGPVLKPGPVEIPANENFTAGKAIIAAGGFGDFANPKKVQIVRKTESGNKTIIVNLANVLKKGMTEEDVTLEPEDFIIVPERSFNIGL